VKTKIYIRSKVGVDSIVTNRGTKLREKVIKNQKNSNRASTLTVSFLENFTFLQKFLARYFTEQQDIEDVVQETYLRAYGAETRNEIEHPKAFLFQIAKNLALTDLFPYDTARISTG